MIFLTHIVKVPILGCPRRSSVNRIQVTGLIAVSSIFIYVGPVAVLRYVYTVTIIISAARRDRVLGERDDVRQQQNVEAATNGNASRGHSSRVRDRAIDSLLSRRCG